MGGSGRPAPDGRLPLREQVVSARPMLCLSEAWLLIHRVELEPATARLEAAARALSTAGDNERPVRGAVAATRAYLATVVPDAAPDTAIAWAERALADLAADEQRRADRDRRQPERTVSSGLSKA